MRRITPPVHICSSPGQQIVDRQHPSFKLRPTLHTDGAATAAQTTSCATFIFELSEVIRLPKTDDIRPADFCQDWYDVGGEIFIDFPEA
jgi:hypothetical protein